MLLEAKDGRKQREEKYQTIVGTIPGKRHAIFFQIKKSTGTGFSLYFRTVILATSPSRNEREVYCRLSIAWTSHILFWRKLEVHVAFPPQLRATSQAPLLALAASCLVYMHAMDNGCFPAELSFARACVFFLVAVFSQALFCTSNFWSISLIWLIYVRHTFRLIY